MTSIKKVNLNSISQLLNASDENLPSVFGELGYNQSFTLIDIKLALGYSTVIIAGLLYYGDKKFKFNEIYTVTVISIVLYGLISLILMYLTSSKSYKDNKFIGYNDSKKKISVSTWTNNFDPIYNIKIVLDDDEKQTKFVTFEFAKFFDSFGYYKREEFLELLKSELTTVGKKD